MRTRFKTLKKIDPEFASYLLGTFSQNEIAIPIKSYNLGTPEELVTFELQDVQHATERIWTSRFFRLVKIRSLILLLLPLFFVLIETYKQTQFDVIAIILAATVSILFFIAFNIRNDVNDYLSGYDRVNTDIQEKPLNLGWFKPVYLVKCSNLLLVLSVVVAIPLILLMPKLIFVAALVVALFGLGRLFTSNSYKNFHLGELILFLLAGPILVAGFSLAAIGEISDKGILFGLLWGAGVLFLVQLNNFSNIMTSSQHGIKNTITKLGFDSAQRFLTYYWIIYLVAWTTYFVLYFSWIWAAVFAALIFLRSLYFLKTVLQVKSPMGSGPKQARKQGYQIIWSSVACIVLLLLIEHGFFTSLVN